MTQRHLVLGGARSGKTRFALEVAAACAARDQADVLYVATAEAHDAEMLYRIAQHRAERPAMWRTLEAPRNLAQSLLDIPSKSVVIVDCLTLWLSNALSADFDEAAPRAELPTWTRERDAFLEVLRAYAGTLILVSNEVGAGIVPVSALARRFQDEQGWLNQVTARICDEVTLVVAGIAVPIKPTPPASTRRD